MICSQCGENSESSAKFCRECGNSLGVYSPENPRQKSARRVSYPKIAAKGATIGAVVGAVIGLIIGIVVATGSTRPHDEFLVYALVGGVWGFLIGLVSIPFLYYAWRN
jgi:uncharacterized membrane protein YvbJ